MTSHRITVLGTGYLGATHAVCMAELGYEVLGLDVDKAKIDKLAGGEVPFFEPGLDVLLRKNLATGRLQFTTDVAAAVHHGTILLIGVGTPPDEDGSADLQHVLSAARSIGTHMTDYKVVVDKSTVPVGTADKVRLAIHTELERRGMRLEFAVVSNPEFLKEGAAVEDFMRPDRIIVGADEERAVLLMRALYAPFTRNHDRLQLMDVRSAEFTKYAANAMLATRSASSASSFMKLMRVGADIELVRRGIGSDPRIGTYFLYPGAGYGGSCFPKDVKALIRTASDNDVELGVLAAVEAANERQKRVLVDKVVRRFGEDLTGRRFAIWGLAFKPDTDDMREAPSLVVVEELLRRGASINAYDPAAMPRARELFEGAAGITLAHDAQSALAGADALLILTEWREFRSPDFQFILGALRQPVVFDGRNLFDPATVSAQGIEYHAIGRGSSVRVVTTPGLMSTDHR